MAATHDKVMIDHASRGKAKAWWLELSFFLDIDNLTIRSAYLDVHLWLDKVRAVVEDSWSTRRVQVIVSSRGLVTVAGLLLGLWLRRGIRRRRRVPSF